MGRKKLKPEESSKYTQILGVAGDMFSRMGYGSVSMDALADAVPVSKRTLYNHFSDKNALFTAVMESRCQQVFRAFERAPANGCDVEATLSALGRQFLDVVLEPEVIDFYRTIITEAGKFPELGALFYRLGPARSIQALAEYFTQLDAKGVLAIPDPTLAASMFLTMIAGRMQMRCLLKLTQTPTAAEKDTIIRYAVRLFLEGQRPQTVSCDGRATGKEDKRK